MKGWHLLLFFILDAVHLVLLEKMEEKMKVEGI